MERAVATAGAQTVRAAKLYQPRKEISISGASN
jgi:hypothetical protein